MSFDDSPHLLYLKNITKTYETAYEKTAAVNDISLSIPAKSFAMVVGPSGSGKTTLLNIMGCLDKPSSGSVKIFGTDILSLSHTQSASFRAAHIGFIFQHFSLIPVLTAYENVEYPLLLLNVKKAERDKMVRQMLIKVGLRDKFNYYPNQLSGGQKQRVGIARALVKRPKLVLADEPTANLDSKTSTSIIELMQEIQTTMDTTFIFSTHDQNLISHASSIIQLNDGTLFKMEA